MHYEKHGAGFLLPLLVGRNVHLVRIAVFGVVGSTKMTLEQAREPQMAVAWALVVVRQLPRSQTSIQVEQLGCHLRQ